MSDKKISQLTPSTTPLAGTELLPVVQSGGTKKVSVANLTAGRHVALNSFKAETNSSIGVDSYAWLSGYTALDFNGGSLEGGASARFSIYQNTIRDSNGNFPYVHDGAAQRFDFESGNWYWYTAPSGTAGNVATFTNRMTFDGSNGNFNLLTGNLTVSAGKGIDFSADGSAAGMTSELLDDYEEGTWTPVYKTDGTDFASVTMDSIQCKYTKIGNQVTVTGLIRTDALDVTGATGNVYIGGLPFTSSTFSSSATSSTFEFGGDYPSSAYVNSGSANLYLMYKLALNSVDVNLQTSDMFAGTNADKNQVVIGFTYFV